jgi:hypothetical protein
MIKVKEVLDATAVARQTASFFMDFHGELKGRPLAPSSYSMNVNCGMPGNCLIDEGR